MPDYVLNVGIEPTVGDFASPILAQIREIRAAAEASGGTPLGAGTQTATEVVAAATPATGELGPAEQEDLAKLTTYAATLDAAIESLNTLREAQAVLATRIEANAVAYRDTAIAANQEAAKKAELLAASSEYLTSLVTSATKQNALAAAKAEELAGSSEYLASEGKVAAENNLLAATKAQALAGDGLYIASTAVLAEGQAALAAAKAKELAGSGEYVESTTVLATEQNLLAAAKAEELAGSREYLASEGKVAAENNLLAAAKAEELAGSGEYLASASKRATEDNLLAAAKAEELAGSGEYLASEGKVAAENNLLAAIKAEALAGDGLYIASTAVLAEGQAALAAAKAKELAGSAAYSEAIAADTAAKAEEAAKVEEGLAADGEYAANQARAAAAKAVQAAKIEEQLAADDEYTANQTRTAAAKAEEAAKIEEQLAADDEYTANQTRTAAAKAEEAAKLQESLAADDQYTANQTRTATAKAVQAAKVEEELAADAEYATNQARAAAAKADQAANTQELLIVDENYILNQAFLVAAKQFETAKVQELLEADDAYAADQARAAAAKALIAAKVEEQLAADDEYTANQTRTAAAKAEEAAKLQESLAADDEYTANQTRTAAAKAVQAAKLQESLAADDEYTANQTRTAAAKAVQAAKLQEELAADDEYTANQTRTAAAKAIQAAKLQESLAADDEYTANQTRAAVAKAVQAAKLQEQLATDDESLAATVANRIAKANQAARLNEALLADDSYITATAEAAVALGQLKVAVKDQTAAALKAAGLDVAASGGVAAGAAASARPGPSPESGGLLASLGFGGGAAQLGQFAAFTAVFSGGYTILNDLRTGIKDAEALNQQLALIKTQADGIGQGAGFGELRKTIIDTAAETGVAGSQVATLAGEFLGLRQNALLAAEDTRAAAQILLVIGGNAKQEGPQIAALAEDVGTSVEHLGNVVVQVQRTTGRSGQDILAAIGTLAPAAKEVGLNFDQLVGLIDATATHSAKSGSVIADTLGRVLSEVGTNVGKLALTGLVQLSPEALAGNVPAVLNDVIKQFAGLGQKQQTDVLTALGIRPRDFTVISGLLSDTTAAYTLFNSKIADNNQLSSAATAKQDSLQGALNRVHQSLTGLGDAILHSGLLDFFKVALEGINPFIEGLDAVVSWLGKLNSALGGVPGEFAGVLGVIAVLEKLNVIGKLENIGGRLLGSVGLGAGGTAAAEAGTSQTTSRTAETEAINQNAQALTRATAARQTDTAALSGEAVAEDEVVVATTNVSEGVQEMVLSLNESAVASQTAFQRTTTAMTGMVGTLGAVGFAIVEIIQLGVQLSAVKDKLSGAAAVEQQSILTQLENGGLTVAQARALPESQNVAGSILHAVGLEPTSPAEARDKAIQQYLSEQSQGGGASVNEQLSGLATTAPKITLPTDLAYKLGPEAGVSFTDLITPTKANLEKVAAAVKSGAVSVKDGQALLDYINKNFPAAFKDLNVAATQAAAAAQAAAAPVPPPPDAVSQGATQQFSKILQDYQSGQISLGTATAQLRVELAALKQVRGTSDANEKAYEDAQNQYDDIVSKSIKSEADLLIRINNLNGGDQTGADVQILLNALSQSSLRPSDRNALVDELTAAYQKEADALKTSVPLAPEVREALLAAEIDNSASWQDFISQFKIGADDLQLVVADVIANGGSFIDAFKKYLTDQTNQLADDLGLLEAHNAPLAEILQAAAALGNDLNALDALKTQKDPGLIPKVVNPGLTGGGSADQALAQKLALTKAKAEYNAALAGNSPTAQAQSEIAQSQADLKDAQDRLNQKSGDLVAQADLWKARTEELKGQYDLAKAAVGIMDAQFDYYTALAKFSGDDVGAAQDQLNKALADLANAPSEGVKPGSAEYINLQAKVVDAQGNKRDAALSQKEDQISFEKQMGQITAAQAVGLYEQLLTIPDLTAKEQQDIQLKIHELINSAQDLQFNLPTDIALPTLYEARRLNETPGGVGYSDSRQISVNLNVFNGADVNSAVATIVSAVSAPPSYGSSGRSIY